MPPTPRPWRDRSGSFMAHPTTTPPSQAARPSLPACCKPGGGGTDEPVCGSGVDGHTETEAIKMSGSSLTQKALLLTVLCLPLGAAVAAPISPFVAMAGTWSGSGVLNTSDGQQERLR